MSEKYKIMCDNCDHQIKSNEKEVVIPPNSNCKYLICPICKGHKFILCQKL